AFPIHLWSRACTEPAGGPRWNKTRGRTAFCVVKPPLINSLVYCLQFHLYWSVFTIPLLNAADSPVGAEAVTTTVTAAAAAAAAETAETAV
ncbi:hypothetical protein AALO_G00166770, partial [Alosa alosa]